MSAFEELQQRRELHNQAVGKINEILARATQETRSIRESVPRFDQDRLHAESTRKFSDDLQPAIEECIPVQKALIDAYEQFALTIKPLPDSWPNKDKAMEMADQDAAAMIENLEVWKELSAQSIDQSFWPTHWSQTRAEQPRITQTLAPYINALESETARMQEIAKQMRRLH